MTIRFLLLPLLLLAGTLFASRLQAQEYIYGGDAAAPAVLRTAPSPMQAPAGTAAAPFPFFDDFSSGKKFVDTVLWMPNIAGRSPGVSIEKGIFPPSKGVATFDGANFAGDMYENVLALGITDSLTSRPFDFSTRSPADNIILSFFIQAGGEGDKPEATDSLVLYFDTTGNYTWREVWSQAGTGISNTEFYHVLVPVDSAEYFHSEFRFRFVSYGAQNGELDQWHLDYVYMDDNRTAADTFYNDASVTDFAAPIMGRLTALPKDQYAGAAMSAFGVNLANRKSVNHSTTLSVSIADVTGGNVLSGTTTVSTPASVPTYFAADFPLPPFSDQTLTNNATIAATATINTGAPDDFSGNDAIVKHFYLDSTLAYDDGISDAAYGLTVARSFCMKFPVGAKDTLTGALIRFSASLYYNSTLGSSHPLEGKGFRLSVWDDFHPDSILTQVGSGMLVDYGDSLNQFIYYPLLTPVVVEDTFWMGLEQIDEMPIGIGFDRTYDNSDRIYYEDATGDWVKTTQKGTLMLRPVFGGKRPVGTDDAVSSVAAAIQIWPNPGSGDIRIRMENVSALAGGNVRLRDLSGRVLMSESLEENRREWNLNVPASVSAGMYWIEIEGMDQARHPVRACIKWICE